VQVMCSGSSGPELPPKSPTSVVHPSPRACAQIPLASFWSAIAREGLWRSRRPRKIPKSQQLSSSPLLISVA
jgi:hypothetical protein